MAEGTSQEEVAALEALLPRHPWMCSGHTTGNHGPKRLCRAPRMMGGFVCRVHGGSAPGVRKAAKMRLLEEVEPTIHRLIQIRDQNDHMPSALGAGLAIMNRTLGKASEGPPVAGGGFNVQIGIGIGSIPASVKVTPVEDENDTIDAEFDASDE